MTVGSIVVVFFMLLFIGCVGTLKFGGDLSSVRPI
jgi:hypothetical protein